MMRKLESLLQFLALEDRDKRAYLPENLPVFTIRETSIKTNNAFVCLAYECDSHLEHCWIALEGKQLDLVKEIRILLAAVLELGAVYPSIWNLDENPVVCCELDELWRVVRRLARLALVEFGWVQANPKISFEDLFSIGRLTDKNVTSARILEFGTEGGFSKGTRNS